MTSLALTTPIEGCKANILSMNATFLLIKIPRIKNLLYSSYLIMITLNVLMLESYEML